MAWRDTVKKLASKPDMPYNVFKRQKGINHGACPAGGKCVYRRAIIRMTAAGHVDLKTANEVIASVKKDLQAYKEATSE